MSSEQKFGKVLGELESEVMEIIWQAGEPVSVREITSILQKKRQIAYTTVMTVMGRLVEKGLLKCQRIGKAYTYTSSYTKDKFLTKITRQIMKNLSLSFGEIAVAHFAQEIEKLSPKKRRQLLKILKTTKR